MFSKARKLLEPLVDFPAALKRRGFRPAERQTENEDLQIQDAYRVMLKWWPTLQTAAAFIKEYNYDNRNAPGKLYKVKLSERKQIVSDQISRSDVYANRKVLPGSFGSNQ